MPMTFNKFIIMGVIKEIDLRDTGAAMIWIEASDREESSVRGAPVPTWFTPIIPVRFPAYVIESTDKTSLVSGTQVVVEGRLQGVKRNVDGKDFYIAEIQANKLTPEKLPEKKQEKTEEEKQPENEIKDKEKTDNKPNEG